MELHTTDSEQELSAQAQLALTELSSRNQASYLTVSSYLAAMTSTEDTTPTYSRCPTSKECGEIIKKLRNENWDLKCRYVTEKMGRTAPITIPKASGKGTTTLTPANIKELAREIHLLKESKQSAERKVCELENQNRSLQETIALGQQREALIQQRNEELIQKLNVLDHELELANLRKSDECLIDKSLMDLRIYDDPASCLIPLPNSELSQVVHEQQERIRVLVSEVADLKEKLDVATEEVTTKCQLIESLETVLQGKNELAEGLDEELSKCKDKIMSMTQALKDLGYRHAEELTQHNSLKTRYKELLGEYEQVRAALEQMKQQFETLAAMKQNQRSDDISPDLGIESGVEMSRMQNVLQAPKDNSAEDKIRSLKAMNKELVYRLRQTKLALDKTMDRLAATTEQKDEVEKAVCRQLHRTHGILRAARKNLENPSEPTLPFAEDQ